MSNIFSVQQNKNLFNIPKNLKIATTRRRFYSSSTSTTNSNNLSVLEKIKTPSTAILASTCPTTSCKKSSPFFVTSTKKLSSKEVNSEQQQILGS